MNGAAISAWAILALILVSAGVFHRRQNEGTRLGTVVGGAISAPKALWLAYAIGSWFLVPLIYLFSGVHGWLRIALLAHVLIWWLRGALEHFMIHKWYNWSPRYGIGHDLAHIGMLVVLGWKAWQEFAASGESLRSIAGFGLLYLAVTVFATIAEAVFAFLFFGTRGGMKNPLIYFASDEPKYRLINRLTASVNCVVYTHLFVQAIGLSLC